MPGVPGTRAGAMPPNIPRQRARKSPLSTSLRYFQQSADASARYNSIVTGQPPLSLPLQGYLEGDYAEPLAPEPPPEALLLRFIL